MDVVRSRNKTPIANPYIVGRPLTGGSTSLYVGRDDVFDWVGENLAGSTRPNALLLYGRRRIGKTSTLYQLVEGDRGRTLREGNERAVYPAYIDLQRLVGRPTDEWLTLLARAIHDRISPSLTTEGAPKNSIVGVTGYAAFDRCLDSLEETLPGDSLILLAIDELEQVRAGIDAGTLDPQLMPFLRSQIQHRDRIVFLLSGATGLLDPYWNSITNLTARWELEPLDHGQTLSLIRRPVADILTYEDAAVEAIWQRTAGHPFHIQTICHCLVSLANRRHHWEPIATADVEYVLNQLDKERFFGDQTTDGTFDKTTHLSPVPKEAAGL